MSELMRNSRVLRYGLAIVLVAWLGLVFLPCCVALPTAGGETAHMAAGLEHAAHSHPAAASHEHDGHTIVPAKNADHGCCSGDMADIAHADSVLAGKQVKPEKPHPVFLILTTPHRDFKSTPYRVSRVTGLVSRRSSPPVYLLVQRFLI